MSSIYFVSIFFFHWTNTAVSIFYLVSISFYLVFHFSCRILLVISRLPRIDVFRSEVSLFQTQWQQEDGNRAQLCILYFSCYSVIDYYNSVIGLSLIGHNGYIVTRMLGCDYDLLWVTVNGVAFITSDFMLSDLSLSVITQDTPSYL